MADEQQRLNDDPVAAACKEELDAATTELENAIEAAEDLE